jgi:hypothetical protein
VEPQEPRYAPPFRRIFLVAAILGALVYFWGIPEWMENRRRSNEREVYRWMGKLTGIESDFRTQDRDGNSVQDFWTGDLASLFRYGMISREMAEADAEPRVPLVPRPVPYKGYYFKALRMDNSEKPPVAYRQDTDKGSGKVHHLQKFGFVAWPAEWGVTGTSIYIVNENNTVFPRRDLKKLFPLVDFSKDFPQGDLSQPPSDWPTDYELRWYSKVGG